MVRTAIDPFGTLSLFSVVSVQLFPAARPAGTGGRNSRNNAVNVTATGLLLEAWSPVILPLSPSKPCQVVPAAALAASEGTGEARAHSKGGHCPEVGRSAAAFPL